MTIRKMLQRALIALTCFAMLAPLPALNAQQSLRAKVVQLAQPYIESETAVGLSIGVIQGDEVKTVHLGKTSENGKRPTNLTVYEIGSISKVFTGLLLADAVTENKLKLDQSLQDLLPDGISVPKSNARSITLLDLSTHVSGLPRLPDNMPMSDPADPYTDYTSTLAYEFLNKHKLARAPGEKYEYSNYAVSLLGHLVCERAQKQTYENLLRKRITEPLGMKSTAVRLSPAMKKRFATPYASPGVTAKAWEFADAPGAGGIRSTTSDMLLFAKAQLDPPKSQIGKAIELAWTKHRKTDAATMGLGWHFAGNGNTRWHNGGTGGFHSMLMVNREDNAAVVLLANTSTGEIDRLGRDLMKLLAGTEVTPRAFAKQIKVDPKIMQRYVGRYELAPNFVFTVSHKEGKLMVGVTNQPTHQVFPKSETTWFYKVVPAELTFQVNKAGKCTALELFQNGVRQTAKRTN